mgnify:CR=1 FL=1
MIDIAAEMKAAHKQYLQDEWDKWLITGWKNGNVIMWNCVKGFIAKYNITFDELNELERNYACGVSLLEDSSLVPFAPAD